VSYRYYYCSNLLWFEITVLLILTASDSIAVPPSHRVSFFPVKNTSGGQLTEFTYWLCLRVFGNLLQPEAIFRLKMHKSVSPGPQGGGLPDPLKRKT